jgi:hypothetical protein
MMKSMAQANMLYIIAYGNGGNDRIMSPEEFSSGGAGNDLILFLSLASPYYGRGFRMLLRLLR